MTLWTTIKRYAIYRRLLVSYLILVLISILLVSTLLYQRFAYQSETEINRVSQTTLDQIGRAAEAVQDRAVSVGNELLHDPKLITAMLNDKADPLLENEVVVKLAAIQAVYPFIEYISVYNGNTGRYLNYRGITKAMDGELIQRIESGSGGASIVFVPRRLDLSPLGTPLAPKPILSYILYSTFSNLMPRSGAIVININEETALGELSRTVAASPGSEWMVVDKHGLVISHNEEAKFLNNVSGEADVERVLASAADRGHFTAKANGVKTLVTYARSADTGFAVIGRRPYDELRLLGSGWQRTAVWAGLGLLAVVGVLLAFRLASGMFRPYSAFQSRASTLEATWKKAYPLLQESYVRRLLAGKAPAAPGGGELLDWRAPEGGGRYCVVVVKLDDYRRFLQRSYADQDLIRFAIRNIADELMAAYGAYRTLEVENDHLVILAQLAEPSLPERFLLTLVELQVTVRQYFRMTVSVGVGDVVESEGAIKESYRAANGYLAYRLFLGHGSILDRDAAASRAGRGGDYPSKAEASLLEAVRLGKRKEAERSVDRFLDAVRPLDYKYAFGFANQLVAAVQKQFENALSFEEGDYETHAALLYSFSDFETLDDIGAALKGLCATVAQRIERKRSGRSLEIVDGVLELVRRHYNDPQLSLEWAADRIHYSSGHLSKLFKQTAGQSFNDYVNAVRLEEAVRLLRHTNDSAAAISEKVGLGSTYFFTLFKKTYGMTPAQYRLSMSAGEPGTGTGE
ncbi:helix-turn-helix domain-containing protein [Paenibacillus sp. MWE-103]|uniref:Helix-turn-helix domain-containing protein n=1 Tax=Paenibacillus artemisiicola TaxID=1172618 RepID=A0ABS3WKY3_9BACL|nr:helix-turn-helix domain-containing protein [Paenibacillus artemisiicola]MBO7748998.1 helix-turn-helix domain-containing protein [Paenibacillus artemisiicola]